MKTNSKNPVIITPDDVKFTIELLEEHCPVDGSMRSGCKEYEKAERMQEVRMKGRLNKGDLWAWCTVKVTATFRGVEGEDYLGCCNYKDEDDFKAPGGYWEDMKASAFAELKERLQDIVDGATERA
jgi:hypothetical protein